MVVSGVSFDDDEFHVDFFSTVEKKDRFSFRRELTIYLFRPCRGDCGIDSSMASRDSDSRIQHDAPRSDVLGSLAAWFDHRHPRFR